MILPKLIPISTKFFSEGMYVASGIYYLYHNAYVMLCRNVKLTREHIEKIHKIAQTWNGIYIEEAHYEEIWNESIYWHSMAPDEPETEYQKAQKEYNKILSETVCLLGEAANVSREVSKYTQQITDMVAKQIGNTDSSIILDLIHLVHEKDNYLYTHSANVSVLNGMVGNWLKLPPRKMEQLIKTGLLHDVGKLRVPYDILNKPGRLTEEEFEQIKLHPIHSYEMLKESGEIDGDILMGVGQHHEKMNGRGYPDGLEGDEISLFAKITAVNDVYDAMVSKRCYKEPNTPFDVLGEFEQNRFSDLDTEIVDLFLNNISKLLVGSHIMLSTNEIGEVVFMRPNDFSNPIVRVGERIIQTGCSCKCVTMQNAAAK